MIRKLFGLLSSPLKSAGIGVGLGTILTLLIFYLSWLAPASSKIAVLQDQLSTRQSELDQEKAQIQETETRLTAERLRVNVVLEQNKEQRNKLEARIQERQHTVNRFQARVGALETELQAERERIPLEAPHELSEKIQRHLLAAYPEYPAPQFKFQDDGFFQANIDAARGIRTSLAETLTLRQQVQDHESSLQELSNLIADKDSIVQNLTSDLTLTQESSDNWNEAFRLQSQYNEKLEKQLETNLLLVTQYKKKLLWHRIKFPLGIIGGVVVGYVAAKAF